MLTMQALTKGLITVFGGDQTRPNIHIDDITDLYLFLLDNKTPGIFNAGFENISILDIAQRVQQYIPAEVKVTASNDPRSYRLNSNKLLGLGFQPKKTVDDAVRELIAKFQAAELKEDDGCYNIRTMKSLVI